MTKAFALVDGNSFYCSCERLFRPALADRPVIVLSNNDGCAVARTPEAKALGIEMGTPFFRIRELCRRERVAVFSSNYTLYGDISRRMNEVYGLFAPEVEVYSIDESFLDITGIRESDRVAYGHEIRSTVRQWIGIPTCVGIGPTKTLAKLANRAAKTLPGMDGVCDFMDEHSRKHAMEAIDVGDLWGVGRVLAPKLRERGYRTVARLRDMPLKAARALMGVVGERMVLELNGVSCLPLEAIAPQRKGIAVTRSFGRPVTTLDHMREAVAAYATRAAEKLRRHGLGVVTGHVFMHTNRHNGDAWCQRGCGFSFVRATSDTHELVSAAVGAVERCWAPGHRFSKAGIVLTELGSPEPDQGSLFGTAGDERRSRLMVAIDGLNGRYGRGTLFPAAEGVRKEWGLRSERRSPNYTTDISDIPEVVAG